MGQKKLSIYRDAVLREISETYNMFRHNPTDIHKLLKEIHEIMRSDKKEMLDILCVLEGVKIGAYIHKPNRKMIFWKQIDQTKFQRLIPLLNKLGIYTIPDKDSFYITKSRNLAEESNFRNSGYFSKHAHDFLGYPKCCVERYNDHDWAFVPIAEFFLLALAVHNHKEDFGELRKSFEVFTYVSHAVCSIECTESQKIAAQHKRVADKYYWLMKDYVKWAKKDAKHTIVSLIPRLESCTSHKSSSQLWDALENSRYYAKVQDLLDGGPDGFGISFYRIFRGIKTDIRLGQLFMRRMLRYV